MNKTAMLRAAAVSSGLALLAACSDPIGPDASRFDSQRVEAGVVAVEKVAASTALGSLQMVTRFGGDLGAAAAGTGAARWSPGLEEAVERIVASATKVPTHLIPVMRPSVLGKTFIFDPQQRKYVPDPTRTGAPANGVRFILYAESPNGEPNVAREIGYADLTDEKRASPTLAGVRLVVVTEGVTRLNYAFDVTASGGTPSFTVQGFLADGDDRLDFTVTASSALLGSGKATVEATLTAPRQGFKVTARITATPGRDNGDGEIDLTIASGTNRIVVDAATVNGELEATFTVNGKLLARAAGNPRNPEIRGEGGRALTPEEMRALARIVDMADAIFKLVHELVEPAGYLLLIAMGVGG